MNIVIFDIDWQCSVSNLAREASLWYAELSKDSMRVWLWALDCLGVSGLWSKCHPRGGGREEPGHCRQAGTGRGLAPALWSLHWHQVILGLNPFRESLDFLCWRDANYPSLVLSTHPESHWSVHVLTLDWRASSGLCCGWRPTLLLKDIVTSR